MYLAQCNRAQNYVKLYECALFSTSSTQINVSELNLTSMIGSLSYTEWFVPSVASVGNKKYLALGAETKNEFVGTSTTEITKMWLKYAVWTAGQFSSAEIKEAEWMILASTNIYSYYNEKFTRSLMMSIIGFNHKNDSDLLFNAGYVTLASQRNQYQQIRIEYKLASLPQQIFGDPDAAYITSGFMPIHHHATFCRLRQIMNICSVLKFPGINLSLISGSITHVRLLTQRRLMSRFQAAQKFSQIQLHMQ